MKPHHPSNRADATWAEVGPLDEKRQESAVTVFVEEDPYSVIRMVSPRFQAAILALPEEYKGQEEGTLRRMCKPYPTINQLRMSFWLEYERARAVLAPRMTMTNIYTAIMDECTFYKMCETEPRKLAWILCPPISYTTKLEEMLHRGYERVSEILDADIITSGGKLDVAAAKLVMQATMMIDMRLKGGIVQKMEHTNKSLSLSVNMRAGSKEVVKAVEHMNMEEVEEELRKLERQELNRRALELRMDKVRGTAEEGEIVIPETPTVVERIPKPLETMTGKFELVTYDQDGNMESEIVERN